MAHVSSSSGWKIQARLRQTLGLCGLALTAACSDGSLQVELTHSAAETDPLYDHASLYLNTRLDFSDVTASLDCPEALEGSCLLRMEGRETAWEGEGRSLLLQVVTGAQPLPGTADLAAPYLEPWGVAPVTYVAQEEVDPNELAERYHYTCTYATGTITFFEAPVVDQVVTGQFDDLQLSCTQQTSTSVVPALLRGRFSVRVRAALNPTVVPSSSAL